MTTEERHQLESAELEKRNRAKREADQEGQAATQGRGTTVNVFYLGLPGMTTAEMGKDLERINSAYDDLKTGGN